MFPRNKTRASSQLEGRDRKRGGEYNEYERKKKKKKKKRNEEKKGRQGGEGKPENIMFCESDKGRESGSSGVKNFGDGFSKLFSLGGRDHFAEDRKEHAV